MNRGSNSPGCLLVAAALAVLVAVVLGRPLLAGDPDPVEPIATEAPVARNTAKPSGRRPGVVNIESEQGLSGTLSAGTGIVFTADGLVLTNNHVIQGSTAVTGTDPDRRRSYRATVLGYDKTGDLAVIRLERASGLKTAVFGDSSRVRPGDPVTAVGNAGGKGGTPAVVTGAVTALDQTVTARDQSDGTTERLTGLIETSTPIKPGDSGGPLLNTGGQVIGINTAASGDYKMETRGARRGYAIPATRALAVARQIERGQASPTVHIGRTALLGVRVRAAGTTTGALVAELVPNTPASSTGMRRGAVIVALGGVAVDSPEKLTELMLAQHPGDVVRLEWIDPNNGPRRSAEVTLTEGPPQ
ncbi:S1C family serine protease [Actinomadura hibisca]|uniref:S1C family serine protease n=1 Tax=Actinomadura hibisca TaxID=68565 RepID=UPI000830BB02|nr:trypsin-like peptidase domain-containing protein [Actinomadura hibisca]